eukprot:SAG11_NODE_5069_length_1673_cov_1.497143_3_plen_64_part_00
MVFSRSPNYNVLHKAYCLRPGPAAVRVPLRVGVRAPKTLQRVWRVPPPSLYTGGNKFMVGPSF